MLFVIGSPSDDAHGREEIASVPERVTRTGGARPVVAGMMVAVKSGCLACHKLGKRGSTGPGRNLTHIGSTRSEAQIAHALVAPSAPMPSFKGLPVAEFKALVQFLASLN